jgi:hypothetical protein
VVGNQIDKIRHTFRSSLHNRLEPRGDAHAHAYRDGICRARSLLASRAGYFSRAIKTTADGIPEKRTCLGNLHFQFGTNVVALTRRFRAVECDKLRLADGVYNHGAVGFVWLFSGL